MSKIGNIIKKLLLCFAVFIAVFFAIGIFFLFYNSYRCTRVPVYKTVMTDCKVVQQEGQSKGRTEMNQELQKFMDNFGIKTLNCFLFQGHPQRPVYCILMVGDVPANADFSEYAPKKYALKSNKRLFSTLKICGDDPRENEFCLKLEYCLFDTWVFVYRNHIVFEIVTENPTFLQRDEKKQAFLEQYIAPLKK